MPEWDRYRVHTGALWHVFAAWNVYSAGYKEIPRVIQRNMYIFCVMQPLTHWRRTNWGTILWNFQLHFFVWKCLYYNINFTEMCHKVPINEKHLLAQIMARFRTGDEPWHQGDAESSVTINKCQIQVLNGSRYWHLFNQYTDVIMSTMVSQITSLTTVYSTVYSGTDYKKNTKAPRHWPLCGEFTGDRWIPRTKGQ